MSNEVEKENKSKDKSNNPFDKNVIRRTIYDLAIALVSALLVFNVINAEQVANITEYLDNIVAIGTAVLARFYVAKS